MAKFNTNAEFDILAAPATYSCVLNDPIDRYDIISVGSVTVGGTASINVTGTPVEGTTIFFRYLATIAGGTVDILGTNVPTYLLQKGFEAEAYYDGAAWNVAYYPDVNQTEVIDSTSIVDFPSDNIVQSYTTFTSANVGGDQVMESVDIPANTFDAVGQAFKVVAWGTATNNPAQLKTLKVKVRMGATVITLATNTTVTDIIGNWQIEAICVLSNLGTGEIVNSGITHANSSAGASSEPYNVTVRPTAYSETVTQAIEITGTETTPTGGQFVFLGVRVNKI